MNMKKIMFTRADDGGLSVVIPAPKAGIEKVLGPLTQEQYENHVWDRSVPHNAINPRYVDEEGIPSTREFRNAWCDVTPEAKVDIDLVKAKDLQLNKMREERKPKLAASDTEFMLALEKGEDLTAIKAKKKKLRECTDPLKALSVSGYNDPQVLAQIKLLGTLVE